MSAPFGDGAVQLRAMTKREIHSWLMDMHDVLVREGQPITVAISSSLA